MYIIVWCFDRGSAKEGETKTQRSGDVTGQGRVSFPNPPTTPRTRRIIITTETNALTGPA